MPREVVCVEALGVRTIPRKCAIAAISPSPRGLEEPVLLGFGFALGFGEGLDSELWMEDFLAFE